ncbi:MAG: UvrD-helicase domain-containing protein [bacterium]|nr:UvrD-helicase domain-containing protein [bacterium]
MKFAIFLDFLESYSNIPKRQQTKVRDFIEKFKRDPRASGINYEKIHAAKDKNLRSVRIDDTYRGIVLKPEVGDVYALLWVDHHDAAYAWARSKKCVVHPDTGSLQVLTVSEELHDDTVPHTESPAHQGMFHHIKDKHLLRLGIPQALLEIVHAIENEEELAQAEFQFPEEAREALWCLAAGFTLEETYRELEKHETPETVDTDDFAAALDNDDSMRRFYVVHDDLEFEAILNAPLERWRVFLHPTQRRMVRTHFNGPARVLGGAGTGKTVVAMHRARWLAESVCSDSGDRVLFTTFTRNLAADIQENLSKICPDAAFKNVEVVNLDRWVNNFLRSHDYPYTIDYSNKTKALWDQAMHHAPSDLNFRDSFYREEWDQVVQPQEIDSLNTYMRASRLGRGTRIGRKERKLIWPVFEEYRLLLSEHNLKEAEDAMRDARLLLEEGRFKLPYRSIVVDEAQDMSAQAFKLLRALAPDAPNSLFIVGDGHQRIYGRKVALSRCGIEIRGRSKRLRINYRTTEEIRRWAVAILEGQAIDDLDGGEDSQKGYKSLLKGVLPHVRHCGSFKEELDQIVTILEQERTGDSHLRNICLVARTNKLIEDYEAQLTAKGFACYRVQRNAAEDRHAPGLRLATMHRVKGLEFDKMIVAGVSREWVPYQKGLQNASDTVARKEVELTERALLYVAATRAKKEVWVTGYGERSNFVPSVDAAA